MIYLVEFDELSSVIVAPATILPASPKAIDVPLIVIDELISAEFGIDVKPEPEPENDVAASVPVLGTYVNFVLDVFAVDSVPELVKLNSGYNVMDEVISFVKVVAAGIGDHVWSPRRYVVELAVPVANLAVGTVPEDRFVALA